MFDATVIISNFNYGRFIESSICSCLDQEPCQIIIVDDASVDDSWNRICKYVDNQDEDHPIYAVQLKTNSGGNARGKNVGIALCKTDLITCLDSDDMLLPGSITVRKRYINKECFWSHGRAVRLESEESYNRLLPVSDVYRSKHTGRYRGGLHDGVRTKVSLYTGVEASTVLLHRKIYEQYGLYDENLKWKIDREMWHRLLYHGCKKAFVDEWVSIYRHHSKQATRNRHIKNPIKVDAMFRNVIKVRKKITNTNTIFLENYDPNRLIAQSTGILM